MTSDLLPPPNLGLALGLGAGAAVAGAAAWAALIVFANYEHGLLAWGIGGLVGFAIVKGGGHGQMLAVCAAVLAVLSIGTGKFFAYQHDLGTEHDRATSFTFVDYLKQSSNLYDVLFVGLGLVTAFSLVQRHTQAMQLAARQQLRAERDAEQAAAAPEEGGN